MVFNVRGAVAAWVFSWDNQELRIIPTFSCIIRQIVYKIGSLFQRPLGGSLASITSVPEVQLSFVQYFPSENSVSDSKCQNLMFGKNKRKACM